MQYQINDYLFDDETFMLFKHGGEVVHFRKNEAILLKFFLQNTDQTLSKAQILDAVWEGKAVSEQVVFQNISHLRALFGNGAIKTYPKKGYKWTLAFEKRAAAPPNTPVQDEPLIDFSNDNHGKSLSKRTSNTLLAMMFATIAVLAIYYLFPAKNIAISYSEKVSLLPIIVGSTLENNTATKEVTEKLWHPIQKQGQYQVLEDLHTTKYQNIFSAPREHYNLLKDKHQHAYLVAIALEQHHSAYSARLLLINNNTHWQSNTTDTNLEGLHDKLGKQLQALLSTKLLEVEPTDTLSTSTILSLIHKTLPEDLTVLYRLAESLNQSGQAHKAKLMSAELLEKANATENEPFQAMAYFQMAKSLTHLGHLEQAKSLLDDAHAIFSQYSYYPSLIAVAHARLGIAFANGFDYYEIKNALLQAIEAAQRVNDPIQEFSDTLQMSHIAGNLQKDEDHSFFINQAKHLLSQHQLSDIELARYHVYAGIHEDHPTISENHLRQALLLFPKDFEDETLELGRTKLIEQLLSEERWQEAIDTLDKVPTKTSKQQLGFAKVYASQQIWQRAEQHALDAFKIASINNQLATALDSALFLANFYDQHNQQEQKVWYLEFIKREYKSQKFWGSYNIAELQKLGVNI
ncbi:winged helix-turn-helix domain-containing protein [Agaribacter flavus]|uniref:Winged helix-turn-helix domain-containing protein n=1 Tax=Agaribacter flavus TaxID=1902781 RepID=A0ABV7FU09_9ALTE